MSDDFLSEDNKPFVRRQTEAITRTLRLKTSSAPMTFDDVTGLLAEAEEKAEFVCGFIALHTDVSYKVHLKDRMVSEKLICIDAQGLVSLTASGRQLAETPLPDEIESNI